jgi:hypothetical protein
MKANLTDIGEVIFCEYHYGGSVVASVRVVSPIAIELQKLKSA